MSGGVVGWELKHSGLVAHIVGNVEYCRLLERKQTTNKTGEYRIHYRR